MGYTTEFEGQFTFNKKLDDETMDIGIIKIENNEIEMKYLGDYHENEN